MRGLYLSNGALQENYVRDAVNFIAEHQQRDGSIPWYAGHSLDVWELMKKPALTRWLEAILNPLMGKSIVMYFKKALPVL